MAQQKISPEKYIITKGRGLLFRDCLISEGWQEQGMASIAICKKMPSGKYIIGLYMVDTYCLGLKNTNFRFNLTREEYDDFMEEMSSHTDAMIDCDITEAHNIIYGAIDYAEELGFSPQKDFRITEHLLDPELIDDGIDEIEFGKDGKPFYVSGPDDNVKQILAKLEKNPGPGNYDFMALKDQMDDDYY